LELVFFVCLCWMWECLWLGWAGKWQVGIFNGFWNFSNFRIFFENFRNVLKKLKNSC
jgi:hypothetical protein